MSATSAHAVACMLVPCARGRKRAKRGLKHELSAPEFAAAATPQWQRACSSVSSTEKTFFSPRTVLTVRMAPLPAARTRMVHPPA
jgi:hypothetical protein